MLHIKKIGVLIVLISIVIFIVGVLSSCDENLVDESHSDEMDTEKDIETETETDQIDLGVTIMLDDLLKYTLIKPEIISPNLSSEVTALHTALKKFNAEMVCKVDLLSNWNENYMESEYEIIIGNCNRDESREYLKSLEKINDYGYAIIDKKIVIAGHNDQTTILAIEKFINNIVNAARSEAETIFMSSKMDYMFCAEYAIDDIYINGSSIGDFSIVYSAADKFTGLFVAERIYDAVLNTTGHVLSIVSDSESSSSDGEIYIGVTNRNAEYASGVSLNVNEYCVSAHGDNMLSVFGNGMDDTYAAVDKLCKMIEACSSGDNIIIDKTIGATKEIDTMTVMSFNVYCGDFTSKRQESVMRTILNSLPDTLGVQEATSDWMSLFNRELSSIYACVGEGREGGSNGEHSAILYKKDELILLESDTLWLSDTPDVAGSKHPSSSLPRIVTYAVFERISDRTRFVHINTHLDHVGKEARTFQSQFIVDLAKNYQDYPIFITGDFNYHGKEDGYYIFTGDGYSDSGVIADKKENTGGTYGSGSSILDYCFTNLNGVTVEKYKVIRDKINGEYPSDHRPILIEYKFIK